LHEDGIDREEDPFSVEVMFDAYLFAVKHHLENNCYTFCPKTYRKYSNKQFEDDLETDNEAFLNDEEFLGKYGMSHESFELLVSKIKDHPIFKQKAIGRKQLPVSHQLMYLLKYLGTGGDGAFNLNLRCVFKKGRGSAKLYKDRCVKAIRSLHDEYYYWPNAQERTAIANRIEDKYLFPGTPRITT
jgi:hypothetical protein